MSSRRGFVVGGLMIFLGLMAGLPLLSAQVRPVAELAFFKSNSQVDEAAMAATLDKATVKPSPAQQKEILTGLLNSDLRPSHFAVVANAFAAQFDLGLRRKYNELLAKNFSADEVNWYKVDEKAPVPFESTNEWSSDPSQPSVYRLRCLDIDSDGVIDLVLLSQVYFGPSPGLAFYARNGGAWNRLYDCSGEPVKIERRGAQWILRFAVTIIAESEPQIIATIVYDGAKKTASLDSKLYYAPQTTIPKLAAKTDGFQTTEAVRLRTSAVIDNKPDAEVVEGQSATLYGNVIAEFPKGARGLVLAKLDTWSFVVFDSAVPPTANSLYHGLDPVKEVNGEPVPIRLPQEYDAGWVESKLLKMN